MISLIILILVAILAYWLIVPIAGLPVIVGIVAAILVLLVGFREPLGSAWNRRGGW